MKLDDLFQERLMQILENEGYQSSNKTPDPDRNKALNLIDIQQLDSNFTFHVEFLLKGGEITDTNFVNTILTWIGQKIN